MHYSDAAGTEVSAPHLVGAKSIIVGEAIGYFCGSGEGEVETQTSRKRDQPEGVKFGTLTKILHTNHCPGLPPFARVAVQSMCVKSLTVSGTSKFPLL
jgi:hypothetical protein